MLGFICSARPRNGQYSGQNYHSMINLTTPLTNQVNYILSNDPALDKEAEGFVSKWQQFLDTGDVALLPLRAGEQPVVWKLGRLSRERYLEIADRMSTEKESAFRTFVDCVSYGLKGVSGPIQLDGKPLVIGLHKKGTSYECCDKDTMDVLSRWLEFIPEVANRIMVLSSVSPLS